MVSYSITLLLAPSSVLDCFALTYSLHHLLLVALFVVPVAVAVGAPLPVLVGVLLFSVGLLLLVAAHSSVEVVAEATAHQQPVPVHRRQKHARRKDARASAIAPRRVHSHDDLEVLLGFVSLGLMDLRVAVQLQGKMHVSLSFGADCR